MKTVGGLRKLRHRGGAARRLDLYLHRGGLQLVRMRRLLPTMA